MFCVLCSVFSNVGNDNVTMMLCYQVARSLDEEEREDTSLRERFKEKWDRTPSAKLTEELRVQLRKYQTHLQTAGEFLVTPLYFMQLAIPTFCRIS